MGISGRSVAALNRFGEGNLALLEKWQQRGNRNDCHFRNQPIDDLKKFRPF